MKRILSLVLCLVFALTAFAGCKGHTHTFAADWSADAENHWHSATCEHTSEKSGLAAHTGTDDGVCDVCEYVTAYIVTVNAPENVTIDGTLSGAPESDVTFTATVDDAYTLTVKGAEIVGEPEGKDGKAVYTVKVAAIKAPTTVEITAVKTVYGEEIASGDSVIAAEKAWVTYYGTVEVDIPAAGKYTIFTTDESGVEFGENTEENLWSLEHTYTFEATEAGKVTIKTSVWPMSTPEDGEVPFEYVVVSCENVTLVGTEGVYTLPTGAVLDVTFTAPTAGLYQIVSDAAEIAWNDMLDSSITISAAEDGEEITFTLQGQDYTSSTFEFDYKVISFDSNTVNEGENKVTLTYDEYYSVEFTAPKAGAYSIVCDSDAVMFYQWNAEYSYMAGIWDDFVTENLEAGDTVSFYILAKDSEATAETLEANVTITHSGYLVEEGEEDTYKSQASADGVLNVFTYAWTGETYVFTAPEGFEISVDNGTTWAREVSVLAESSTISYLVKGSAETADVTIKEFEYRIDLSVGETKVTLTAGVEYSVYVSGFTSQAIYKSIVISWNNASVSGYAGWYEVNSGDQIDYVTEGSAAATLTLDGDADAEVTFTVTDVTADDVGGDADDDDDNGGSVVTPVGTSLVLGDNAIYVTVSNYYCAGVEVSFTATEAGTYTLSAKAGETNASVTYIESEFSSEMIDLPYEFTLEAGESINFMVATSANMTLTEDTIDLVLTKN